VNRFRLEGIEVWKNPKNKFFVFQVHYSANPKKKDPSYRENIKSAMPIRQYMQEYELSWESYAGTPVYPDFQRSIHGEQEPMDGVLGLPLLRGWDFGLTPACVVALYVGTQLRVLCEFTAVNKGAEQFSSEVLAQCRIRFPYFSDWRDCIDPSGAFRKDTDMGTCAGILAKKGLSCIPGPVSWEERRSAVEYYLTRYNKQGANFKISLPDCPVLVRGFEGGYRYDEKAIDVEPQKIRPIKDEHSHPHDALQYICAILQKLARTRRILNVPGIGRK
jgi:hypothetical protein